MQMLHSQRMMGAKPVAGQRVAAAAPRPVSRAVSRRHRIIAEYRESKPAAPAAAAPEVLPTLEKDAKAVSRVLGADRSDYLPRHENASCRHIQPSRACDNIKGCPITLAAS